MSILLATLCLNEKEWLPWLYKQHKDWPGLSKWVFVEAADKIYAETTPSMVTHNGLSVDGTTEFLIQLAKSDSRVEYIPFGVAQHDDPAQCKVPARQAYLSVADKVKPYLVVVVDGDEFYTKRDQSEIVRICRKFMRSEVNGFRFKQRHLWRPPSIKASNLFDLEAIGAYWDIPHTRCWKWWSGMQYTNNHNTPDGAVIRYLERAGGMPQCIHMGFTASLEARKAKHHYYVARGEGRTDHRKPNVICRAAFETWLPGDKLPNGGSVIPYTGPIPEVFQ